jgi:hypothetical protein
MSNTIALFRRPCRTAVSAWPSNFLISTTELLDSIENTSARFSMITSKNKIPTLEGWYLSCSFLRNFYSANISLPRLGLKKKKLFQ